MARVEGFETNHTGQTPVDENGNPVTVGVWGDSDDGIGVLGTNGVLPVGTAQIPAAIAGVEGHSVAHVGVFGRSIEDFGVTGESQQSGGVLGRSEGGTGVLGVSFSPDDSGAGVFGSSVTGADGVVGFVGSATGVIGSSVRGVGVRGVGELDGVAGTTFAARGESAGVLGQSENTAGVKGASTRGIGVFAQSVESFGSSSVSFGSAPGANGLSFSNSSAPGTAGTSVLGNGVDGFSFSATGVRGEGRTTGVHGIVRDRAGQAVVGENTAGGFAGVFVGRVVVTGPLTKGGGGFEIDHPLAPDARFLTHSFVESPDMLNVYSGTLTTDKHGECCVTLPDYCEALNHEFRYQLTVVGSRFAHAIVKEEICGHRFTVATSRPHIKVCWQVTGVRRDAWARANPLVVERDKTDAERGRYLHPELYGKTNEAALHRTASPSQAPDGVGKTLPDPLRDRIDRQLRAWLQAGGIDLAELADLVSDATRLAAVPAAEPGSSLEERWRDVRAMLGKALKTP